MKTRAVLSIAGYDPSGGAGCIADAKTFETIGTRAHSVCSALTFQNEKNFRKVQWMETAAIKEQIDVLSEISMFDYIKIGLIKDLEQLNDITSHLLKLNGSAKIIWDPIIKASAGFEFHKSLPPQLLQSILKKLFLITPNSEELKFLFPSANPFEGAANLAQHCNIILTGGHKEINADDELYETSGIQTIFRGEKLVNIEKHGSGCVFSSALCSYLYQGFTLKASVLKAKSYTKDFLLSSKGLLGSHAIKNNIISRLQYITPDTSLADIVKNTETACKSGVNWVQLRVKNRCYEEWLEIAEQVKKVCNQYQAKFIINDNVQVAKEIGSDGVHLGKTDMPVTEARRQLGPGYIIGATANSLEDLEQLRDMHPDYIGLGPFRFTTTKKNLSPVLGQDAYGPLLKGFNRNIPIIAIGGIQLDDLPEISALGIYGIAVCSSINNSGNPGEAAFGLVKAVRDNFEDKATYRIEETILN